MKKSIIILVAICLASITWAGCSSSNPHEGMVRYNGEWITVEEYQQIKSGEEPSNVTAPAPEPIPSPTPAVGYSRSNPASIGKTLPIEFELIGDTFTAEITLVEVIRGDDAWDLISAANMFNDPPSSGFDYILARIRFHYLSCVPPTDTEFDWFYFKSVSSQGQTFDEPFEVAPEPNLTPVYPGATTEGWEVLTAKSDDPAPLLTFGTESGGPTSRVWFQLY
jgi:hypothetical protein